MEKRVTVLRNIKTGKTYQVGADGMKHLKETQMLIKYEVVEQRMVKGSEKSFLPPEIREEVSEAQRAADAVLNNEKGGLQGRD